MSMLALALLGVLAGPPADSEFEAGTAAYAEKRYAEAAEHFERAHRARPDPVLLFVWAQAERLAGRCDAAVPLYREYLSLDPPDADVEVTRAAIEECGEDPDLVPEPPDPASSGDDPDETEPLDALEPDSPDPDEGLPETSPDDRVRPVGRDPWGHVLTWSGVVIAGVGAGLLGEAHRRRASGEQAADEQAYRDAFVGAPALSRAGIGLLAGGGALVVAGVVRFAVLGASQRRRSTRASFLVPRVGGAGLVWSFQLAPSRARVLR